VALTADAGRIDILGRIDARSAAGGKVALNARDDLLVGDGAVIDASAIAAGGRGGRVSLGTLQGALSLASGSLVNVAGLDAQSAVTDGGVVSLRAPRIGADALGVTTLAGTISGASRIQLEAFRTYQADTLDAVSYGAIAADSAAYLANAPTLLTNLGVAADPRFHLVAGEEIDSAGDLSLNGPLDLLGVRPGGEAGVLTLRAAGNLLLNGSLSDGVAFVSASPGDLPERDTVQVGPSWSYRLTAGASLASADTLATAGGVGDVMIASGALIRTGSGDIDVAAARDIRLADSTAAIYTAGQNRGPGDIPVGTLPVSAQFVQELIYHGDFLEKGGDINLNAARDIVGADGGQFINDWMARAGGAQNGALSDISVGNSWAIDVGKFRQNVGALGGGNVSVEAGGNIDTLSVMLPTTAQPTGPLGSAPAVAGGGDLNLYAGGDLRGGIVYVERGKARLDVGGGVSAAAGSNSLPILGAGATQISLQARRAVAIEAIVNPSALSQSATQGFSEFVNPKEDYFFTYTPDSSATITATSGDVTLRRNDTELNARSTGALNQNQVLGYQVLPASLSVHALQGSVGIGNSFTLYPAPRGNLDIVAAGNIGLSPQGERIAALVLSDADVRLLPDAAHPVENLDDAATRLAGLPSGIGPSNSSTPVHAGDTEPVRIIARDGVLGVDPEAASASGSDRFSLYLAKLARIRAGKISNLNLGLQHDNVGDISVIASKGDIIFPTQRATDANVNSNTNQFRIDGPGRLDVIAAGDIRLAASEGIISRGSRVNVGLPAGGATISVLAGVDPDLSYTAAIDKYLTGSTYAPQLAAYLEMLGVAVQGSAVDTFKSLSLEQQRPLILAVYYNELEQAGIDATKGKPNAFDRGYAATKTLFGADKSHGNLNMFLSRISTLAGGDINIVVPHGFVNAGVANASVVKDRSKLSRLGIVAEGAGNINAMVGDSFLVNQTRVFALDGGDVLVWSENKDIDAGGGAKTTLTVQRTDTLYNFDAVPISLIPPAIAGSGIRTAVTTPGRAPGNVYLFAPSGIVNAGDAGIQSAGNITIAAVKVIGAENIIAGGTTVGVPVDTGGLGASLSSVSAASSSAGSAADTDVGGNKADEGAPLAQAALSWLEVFVMGLGEEDCRQDDIDCLKRQKKQQ
jgi:filamentous hemagglutinin